MRGWAPHGWWSAQPWLQSLSLVPPRAPLADPPPPPFPPSLPGTTETESAQKKGYKLPRHIMANGDLARLINSDEVQVCAPPGSSAPGF